MDDEKQELVAAANRLIEQLGRHGVSQTKFIRLSGLAGNPAMRACRAFGSWAEFCKAAGLTPRRAPGVAMSHDEVFAAMRDAFLAMGGVGRHGEFLKHFRYGDGVLYLRGWKWPQALFEFRKWAERNEPRFPYLAQLPTEAPKPGASGRGALNGRALPQRDPGQPTLGEPLDFRCFTRAPVNETGVGLLFAVVAGDFHFAIEASQAAFPDCAALRRVGPDRWQRVRIEFEFRAANFLVHGHDPKGCDLIVCWEDNLGNDAPVPVFELKSKIRMLTGR